MITRQFLSCGVMIASLAWMSSASGPLVAQSPRPAASGWTQSRTPWGDPDIEGVWTSDSALTIPLERPAQFAGRSELSESEYRARTERDARIRSNGENAIGSFRADSAWLSKSFRQTSLVVEPADGKIPPMTSEAERRRASRDQGTFGDGPFDRPEDFTLYDRCITRGIVGSVLPVVYGNGNRIFQTPGQVVITYEMIHDTRVIPLDGRPHLSTKLRQYLGDSRGHWEGNTLVVETTNLTEHTSIGGNGNGPRHSADLKLTERFTRTDRDVLRYEVTIDDSRTYARPWKISLPLTSPHGYTLLPYDCHEGNYAIRNALSAERVEDKALEEDAKNGAVRARRPVQGLSVTQTVGAESPLVPLLEEELGPPPASPPQR
jgi:hypothetical protein